jgi:flagellar basal-body rod protein FlgF
MDAAIYKALSGALTQMRRLEVTTQDLANVNTPGYKGARLSFSEVLAHPAPASERAGGMVAVGGYKTNMNPGGIQNTGSPFNLAISGDGYFVVATARGERYTRSGDLSLRSDGTIITSQGDPLLGEGGPLQLSGDKSGKMVVAADGTVTSDHDEVGKLKVVRFIDPAQAFKEGGNLFQTPRTNLAEVDNPDILQGGLEQSNVSVIDSMVLLIANQRQFDAYERAVKLMDSATEKMITEGAR